MAGTEADIDFSDMLGLEAGEQLKITQDGEEIKPEQPKEEAKAATGGSAKPAPKAGDKKKGGKGKPVALGVGAEDEEDDLTEEQRRQKVLDGDALNAAALMGIDIQTSIEDIPLKTESDYANFASIIQLKLKTANPKRAFLVAFANDMLKNMSEQLTSEDLDKVEKKLKVLFNDKLKEEKGSTNNKKKTTTAKSLKVDRDGTNIRAAAFEDYEVDGMQGTDDYGGYNQVDFM